jgi:hypothetical protein
MANPLVFAAGTITANSSHSLKITKVELTTASATAASAQVTDISAAILIPTMSIPATVNASQVLDFAVPMIWPGGTAAIPTNNFVVTVTGAGASLYVWHR